MKKVTIFGGAAPAPGEQAYKDAYRLGSKLAAAGFTVVNGGYVGTMEAVSRGAAEAGGTVIGVTCDEIENYRPTGVNPWVSHEIRCAQLRQRLLMMIELGDFAIALPGGVGTLTEILTTWNHLLIGAIPGRPLILVSSEWRRTIEVFIEEFGAYITPSQRKWIQYARDVDEAFRIVKDQTDSDAGQD